MKYPKDTDTTKTSYSYDSMYRMATATAVTDTGTALTAGYTYTDDLLTRLQTGSTTYNFGYGNFDLRSSITIGNRTLAGYTYTDRTNDLSRLDYGNGNRVQYEYDQQGRVVSQTYEDGDTVTYRYDNSGALATVTDSATGRKTTYYYDFTDRLMKYAESGSDYSHSVEYTYDNINNLTALVEIINSSSRTTSYTYDNDNRVTSITNSGINKDSTADDVAESYTYDSYGRVQQKVTTYGGATILTETYTYRVVSGKQTGQVATMCSTIGDRNVLYTYDYDSNGNITSVSDGSYTTTYSYDSANQLIRANNQAAGVTWVYTYDDAGNILNKSQYAYTTGSLGSATSNYAYNYGDSSWGDLLTNWNGVSFSYDTIGNLTNDGSYTYTWEHGRELASMSSGSTTWSFVYDAEGMRTSRGDGSRTYSYVYNGGSLSQQMVDGHTLRFTYDASGRPISVTYDGTEYYYTMNLQGDITAILDGSGTAVVQYTYDAWGNILSTTGTLSSTLGFYNPLRYRGYVYDAETGLYYLQSRYYKPSMGRFINADALASTGEGLLGNNMFAYCNNNPINYSDPTGCLPYYTGEPGYEWAWDLGWLLKEKLEEYKEEKEKRKQSVTYTPYLSGKGAAIGNAHNITNIFKMYEFVTENRGDEIGGSNTGVIVEWAVHNIAYEYATQKGDQKTMDQAGTVDVGYTIWSDNHGIKTAFMIGMYALLAPYAFIYDYNVAILKG